MSETKLKPCPFCGGKSVVTWWHGKYCVQCTDCGVIVQMPLRGTREEATELWNTRKPVVTGGHWENINGGMVWIE